MPNSYQDEILTKYIKLNYLDMLLKQFYNDREMMPGQLIKRNSDRKETTPPPLMLGLHYEALTLKQIN